MIKNKLKNLTSLIGCNSIIIGFIYFVYFHPEYSWFLKTILYTLSILTIVSYIVMLSNNKNKKLKKRKSKTYMTIDIILDVIYIFVFIIMDYKVIFVIYIILIIFNLLLYVEKPNGEDNE